MEKPLSILLIEDEPSECQEIIKYVESKDDVQLVGVTNNIEKALEYFVDFQPDAIILDLELHQGHGDGLTFLDLLRDRRHSYPVYVLVTTNNISHVTHNGARKLGADFIMVKSQEDYCAKRVVEFLYSLRHVIQSNRKTAALPTDISLYEHNHSRYKNRIITELDRIGISPNVLGRKYLLDSIMLLLEDESGKYSTAVSVKYGKSVASVERAMQNAIENAWKSTHIDDLLRYYTAPIRSSKGMPTMTEFIYYYAEKIKNER